MTVINMTASSHCLEALACVVGVTRFHSYLWGHHFTLQTDYRHFYHSVQRE